MLPRKWILFFITPLGVHFLLSCFVPAYSLCLLHQYAHVSCPACNMTSALILLITGRFRESAVANPFLVPVLLFLFFAFIVAIFKLRVPHWIQFVLLFVLLVPFLVTWGGKIFVVF